MVGLRFQSDHTFELLAAAQMNSHTYQNTHLPAVEPHSSPLLHIPPLSTHSLNQNHEHLPLVTVNLHKLGVVEQNKVQFEVS